MAYKALYRKWRPEVFEEVIGQSQVIRTLKNQVKGESISHAYLFSGIRGTGKTSTAKIFARAINCLDPNEGDPCNVCQVCRAILSEQMMDVLEIDAASNNGVDHIRDIRESVKYPPVKGKYKVYIIDEVHMLSTGAFNALLKTLEEPPDHVVFILATTELHKIPATVLSRCLRFSFKPLNLEEIRQRLITICRSLDVAYEEAAITTIALNGEGALRDALSILDQCLAYHPGELHYHQVTDVLGSINEELLFQLAGDIAAHDTLAVIRMVHGLYLEGKDLKQLVIDMMKHFRWLLMASLGAEVEGWDTLPEATREQFTAQSQLFKTQELSQMIRQLAEAEFVMKRSGQPQLMLENHLIAMCQEVQESLPVTKPTALSGEVPGNLETIQALDQRIGTIETFLRRLSRKKQKESPSETEDQRYSPPATDEEKNSPPPADEPTSPLPHAATGTSSKEGCGLGESTPLTLAVMEELWPHVLNQMRQDKKMSIQAMAKEAQLTRLDGCQLTLTFKPDQGILAERLGRQDIKEYVATLIQQKTGRRLQLQLVLEEEKKPQDHEVNQVTEKLRQIVPEELIEEEE